MVKSVPRPWLIAYDITDPRRLRRLHAFLRKHAVPVQYSVFHFEGSAAQMGRLLQSIGERIDPDSDDVRAYQLPERMQLTTLGRGGLPEGVDLQSAVSPGLARLLMPADS